MKKEKKLLCMCTGSTYFFLIMPAMKNIFFLNYACNEENHLKFCLLSPLLYLNVYVKDLFWYIDKQCGSAVWTVDPNQTAPRGAV